MDVKQLTTILSLHALWLANDVDGQYANLRSADLRSANLQGANLKYAKGLGQFVRAPKEGAIIGYKKAGDLIVKLLIPATAKRVNAIGSFKCRCDKAKVLAILNVDGTPSICQSVKSTYTARFVYTVGQLVQEPEFDPSDRIECSKGIHFFMTFEEAVEYF